MLVGIRRGTVLKTLSSGVQDKLYIASLLRGCTQNSISYPTLLVVLDRGTLNMVCA